jgi:hypothetical protein
MEGFSGQREQRRACRCACPLAYLFVCPLPSALCSTLAALLRRPSACYLEPRRHLGWSSRSSEHSSSGPCMLPFCVRLAALACTDCDPTAASYPHYCVVARLCLSARSRVHRGARQRLWAFFVFAVCSHAPCTFEVGHTHHTLTYLSHSHHTHTLALA